MSDTLLEFARIQALKAKYFRALDCKDWDLFAETMTDDVVGRYSDGQLSFDGLEPLVGFMRENLSRETIVTMHNGHHPELSLDESAETATGVWYLQDMVIDLEGKTRLYGTGIYEDRYRLQEGEWKICWTGYSRIFEFVEPLSAEHVVLQNRFAPG